MSHARRVHTALAYLPDGWARDVTMTIDARGMFGDVSIGGGARDAEPAGGVVLPGMVNAHSHAFQRAMLGLTHAAGPSTDNFWSCGEPC